MPKLLTCRDVGVDCDFQTSGDSVDEILKAAREHAVQAHGIKELPGEMVASMRRAIRDG